jgi:hypothetical protein
MNKYDKNEILDVSISPSNDMVKDLRKKIYAESDIKPVENIQYPMEAQGAWVVTKETLAEFGKFIKHQTLVQNPVLVKLAIPGWITIGGSHAVALLVDTKNKKILYHDSYGQDLRKDIKDLLLGIFPGYFWEYKEKQTQFEGKTDNSCDMLSEYNLRDMLNQYQGLPEKYQTMTSEQLREHACGLLQDIQEEKISDNNLKAKKLSFGSKAIKTHQTEQELSEHKQKVKKAFEYKLYNEPNYSEIMKDIISDVLKDFESYRSNLMIKNNLIVNQ